MLFCMMADLYLCYFCLMLDIYVSLLAKCLILTYAFCARSLIYIFNVLEFFTCMFSAEANGRKMCRQHILVFTW